MPVVVLLMATVSICIFRPFIQGLFHQPLFWGLLLFSFVTMSFVTIDLLLHAKIFPHKGHVLRNATGITRTNGPCTRRGMLHGYLSRPRGLGRLLFLI